MSKATKSYVVALVLCVALVLADSNGYIDFGGFANGLALLIVVFAILAFVSALKDRKASNG